MRIADEILDVVDFVEVSPSAEMESASSSSENSKAIKTVAHCGHFVIFKPVH